MAARRTQSKGSVQTVKVRFLRPVKMGGRWYLAGEGIVLSAKIAREFLRRGLVEKLKDSRGG
ncbi:MAG: hypothetical protein U9Q76_04175 [candidate division WOR-3 bacterium]|nr:hypothetical protein [candidate division WOR-3 bacterium]